MSALPMAGAGRDDIDRDHHHLLLDRSPTTGDPTSPASASVVVAVSGLRRDNVRNVLKVGKAARHSSPAQSAGDEVEGLPAAAETVEDALAGGVEFVDPVDRGAVPGDVGGEAPVPCVVGGAEELAEGGLGPPKEVQEPLGEGLPPSTVSSPSPLVKASCVWLGRARGGRHRLRPRLPPMPFPRPWWRRLGTS